MKRFARTLTLALAVVLLMSVLPMGAMAVDIYAFTAPWLYENYDPSMNDPATMLNYPDIAVPQITEVGKEDVTFSYDGSVVFINGKPYQPAGIHVNPFKTEDGKIVQDDDGGLPFNENLAANGVNSLTIPKRPEGDTPEIKKAQAAWDAAWRPAIYEKDKNGKLVETDITLDPTVFITYVPHKHHTGKYGWSWDANNHWKYCTACGAFVYLNWHQDVNSDGVCDVCKQPMSYRTLTVEQSEGGKVTLSVDKASCGTRVAVTVTPDAGYKLAEIRAKNVNDKPYSITPCYEDVKGSQYHFIADVYDINVTAKFVKE